MAHGESKIAMPVSTVEAIAFIEVHDPRNVWKKITRSGHVAKDVYFIDLVLTRDCGSCRFAGGNDKFPKKNTIFEGISPLRG